MIGMLYTPETDRLRNDPRFKALLKKIGIPDTAK
jgi:hypothetical protein